MRNESTRPEPPGQSRPCRPRVVASRCDPFVLVEMDGQGVDIDLTCAFGGRVAPQGSAEGDGGLAQSLAR